MSDLCPDEYMFSKFVYKFFLSNINMWISKNIKIKFTSFVSKQNLCSFVQNPHYCEGVSKKYHYIKNMIKKETKIKIT